MDASFTDRYIRRGRPGVGGEDCNWLDQPVLGAGETDPGSISIKRFWIQYLLKEFIGIRMEKD